MNRRWMRRTAAMSAADALALGPTGCGGAAGSTSAGSGKELTYWSMWKQGEPQQKALSAATDDFTAETGIKVKVQWQGRGFFRSLPAELEEAAALDGASPSYTFWRIMLPLARSGLITLLLLNVINHWGETFFALVFIQEQELQTLPLALLGFMQQMQYNGADWGGLFAGIAVVVLPLVALYVWLGRRIIEGMTLGSGK